MSKPEQPTPKPPSHPRPMRTSDSVPDVRFASDSRPMRTSDSVPDVRFASDSRPMRTSDSAAGPPSVSGLVGRLKWCIADESVSAFARRCGLSEATIRSYMDGRSPAYDKLVRVADAANVTLDWLATGRAPMRREVGNTGSKAPEQAKKAPLQGQNGGFAEVAAANSALDGPYSLRLDKILQLLADLPAPQREALLDEFFARAQNATELAALRQAVTDLRTAQHRA